MLMAPYPTLAPTSTPRLAPRLSMRIRNIMASSGVVHISVHGNFSRNALRDSGLASAGPCPRTAHSPARESAMDARKRSRLRIAGILARSTAGGKAVVNDGCERQAAVNACERGCEHAGNAAHRSLSRISHRDRNVEPTQRPDLPRAGTATGRARWGAKRHRHGSHHRNAQEVVIWEAPTVPDSGWVAAEADVRSTLACETMRS